jgi:TadE-like protein
MTRRKRALNGPRRMDLIPQRFQPRLPARRAFRGSPLIRRRASFVDALQARASPPRRHGSLLQFKMPGHNRCGNLRHRLGAGHLYDHVVLSRDPRQFHLSGANDGTHPMTLSEIRRDARGTTAVEFGLTGPIFFAVLFGVIEGGLLLWTQVRLQHGVEMAARYATVTAAANAAMVPANLLLAPAPSKPMRRSSHSALIPQLRTLPSAHRHAAIRSARAILSRFGLCREFNPQRSILLPEIVRRRTHLRPAFALSALLAAALWPLDA